MNQYRQGDILIERVNHDSVPDGAKRQMHRAIARGKATGHDHSIEDSTSIVWFVGDDEDTARIKFAHTRNETRLIHQEHDAITLESGMYKFTRQREYSPEAIRNVAD